MAYSQLQKLYFQAAREKEVTKAPGTPTTTSHNNSYVGLPGYPATAQHANLHLTNQQQYDQIAAVLLNRNTSLLEMNSLGQQQQRKTGAASPAARTSQPQHSLAKPAVMPPDRLPESVRRTPDSSQAWSGTPASRYSPHLNAPTPLGEQPRPSHPGEQLHRPPQGGSSLAQSVASQLPEPEKQGGLKDVWKMQAELQGKKKVATAAPLLEAIHPQPLPIVPLVHIPMSPPHPQPRPVQPQSVSKAPEPISQGSEKMEAKKSRIREPSAITWKRKSQEQQGGGKGKKRRRREVEGGNDIYRFDAEESPRKRSKASNGSGGCPQAPVGPVYKYMSAMLSREVGREEDGREEDGRKEDGREVEREEDGMEVEREEDGREAEKQCKAIASEERRMKVGMTRLEALKRGEEVESLIPSCPACLEEMVPPVHIYQCGEGHPVCAGCRPKLSRCPTCRANMQCRGRLRGRNTGLEQIIRSIHGDN